MNWIRRVASRQFSRLVLCGHKHACCVEQSGTFTNAICRSELRSYGSPTGARHLRSLRSFGQSLETSDFLAHAIELWWNERKAKHPGVNCIQIELDNGPEGCSSRTQFMRRLIEFSDPHQVRVNLVYFPPITASTTRLNESGVSLNDTGTERAVN